MPLGLGYTVEGQLTADEKRGGLQIRVFSARPGRLPTRPPRERLLTRPSLLRAARPPGAMGVAVGGRMRQEIYPDPYGVDTRDPSIRGELFIHLVNSAEFRDLTGRRPPPAPIGAATYTRHGLPWFDLYDEERGTVPTSETLTQVRSVLEKDTERGMPGTGAHEESLDIRTISIRTLRRPRRPGRR